MNKQPVTIKDFLEQLEAILKLQQQHHDQAIQRREFATLLRRTTKKDFQKLDVVKQNEMIKTLKEEQELSLKILKQYYEIVEAVSGLIEAFVFSPLSLDIKSNRDVVVAVESAMWRLAQEKPQTTLREFIENKNYKIRA